MSQSHKPGVTLDEALRRRQARERQQSRRTASERFAHLSDRLTRSLPAAIRGEPADAPHAGGSRGDDVAPSMGADDAVGGEAISEPEYPFEDELTSWYEQVVPRFPVVRSGYDCTAVEEHIASLERELSELDHELAELRARTPTREEVAAELKRVGEQTSTILLAAHDRARETTRQAQEQADRRVAEAKSAAAAMTEAAERKRAEIQRDIDRLVTEWNRLLGDVEGVAGTLSTVAHQSKARVAPAVGNGDVSESQAGGATDAATGS